MYRDLPNAVYNCIDVNQLCKFNGIILICVMSSPNIDRCKECFFFGDELDCVGFKCASYERPDEKSVIFKHVEAERY